MDSHSCKSPLSTLQGSTEDPSLLPLRDSVVMTTGSLEFLIPALPLISCVTWSRYMFLLCFTSFTYETGLIMQGRCGHELNSYV